LHHITWFGNPARISSSDLSCRCCSMSVSGWWHTRPCADAHACALAAQRCGVIRTTAAGFPRVLQSPCHRARYDRRCELADDGDSVLSTRSVQTLWRRLAKARRRLPRWEPRSGVPAAEGVSVPDRSADARSGPRWWGCEHGPWRTNCGRWRGGPSVAGRGRVRRFHEGLQPDVSRMIGGARLAARGRVLRPPGSRLRWALDPGS